MTVDIYNYHHAHDFLRDCWKFKQSVEPDFSLMKFAGSLGLGSSASLSLMLKGRRPVPKKYLPDLTAIFDLKPKEVAYFDALLDKAKAKTLDQKVFYEERLKQLGQSSQNVMTELDSFHQLADPLHAMILEISTLKGFRPDPLWIARKLVGDYSISDVVQALNRLFRMGLLQKTQDGQWAKTNKHITNKPDVIDHGSQEYHKKVSNMAAELITKNKLSEREYNGYAFTMNEDRLPEAKKFIREFVGEFFKRFEADEGQGEKLYQLNLQLFKTTH